MRPGGSKLNKVTSIEIILTHENADFDAIASLVGASKLFPSAIPVLPRRINRNGRAFLALYGAELPLVHPDDLPRRRRIQRVILVDTQSLVTLGGMERDLQVDVIDHHTLDRELPAGWSFSGEPLGATTTLLTEEIAARAIRLSNVEATLLLLGIYEDTGSLSYEGTSPRDARAAAWLMEQGARLAIVNEFLHHPLAPEQRELYEQLLEHCETCDLEGHTIALAWAEASDFSEEISTLAHKLRELLEPSALFVLVALGDGSRIQLVARSTTNDIDVSVVARQFGGGGHARAAAALIRGRPLHAVREKLLAMLPAAVRPGVTVADIMSRGVQVLSPDDTVAEAAARMQRTGHEGYPVVAEGRVVGLLTRREVDRALNFNMSDVPVSRIMRAGSVTVNSGDSIVHLQRVMIESGWGQVPVIENERLVGVVTRTDLIKHMGHAAPLPSRRAEIIRLLERALPPVMMALTREAGRMAEEMGLSLYVVGGFVRDLLLGHAGTDIDFVVEGDAIALTHALCERFGGDTRSHRRFGTGKWLITPSLWEAIARRLNVPISDPAALPNHIDFASARTEFYATPTALPEVERSSIKLDLHRRDFTINTLALRLDPAAFGQLIDFYGGEADLRDRRIRVLHSLSFVDDPTRILRAVRLEQRLGFQIEPRTEQLIGHALPLLDRVSGDRIRHEIELILDEPAPEQAFLRLDELGVLQAIHPDLCCNGWVQAAFRALREAVAVPLWPELGQNFDLELPYFALLTYRMSPETLDALCRRIKVQRRTMNDLALVQELRARMDQLSQPLRPSQIDKLLAYTNDRALVTAWAAAPVAIARDQIVDYACRLRHVVPLTDGQALIARGLKPGAHFRTILATLRAARLDGDISTPEQEEALLQQLLVEEAR